MTFLTDSGSTGPLDELHFEMLFELAKKFFSTVMLNTQAKESKKAEQASPRRTTRVAG